MNLLYKGSIMNNKYTLSANTLFHFTASSKNLESILKNEFHPRYCLENWNLVMPDILGQSTKDRLEIAVPMVSFCDIPLSQISKHVGYYGHYAIGLTKEWGMKNNICPVLYTYNKSQLANSVKNFFAITIKTATTSKEKIFTNNLNEWIKFIKFIKPYEGYLWRDSQYLKDQIKFYDEREWRFCPDIPLSEENEKKEFICFLNKEEFLNHDSIQSANRMIEKFKLSFEPKDVKYIIVDKENEILDMVNKIIQIKQQKYSHADLQVLTTRIISMEHIFEDF
jgi:hypothetical protein